MRATRREFFAGAAAASAAPAPSKRQSGLDALNGAARHAVVREGPTPGFFEGMLLGNGDVGLCITVRPDAIGLHFGKEDAWDIRVSEDHAQHVLPFAKVIEMWERASQRAIAAGRPDATYMENSDPELSAYHGKVRSSYSKPWPRPWPCGSVWLHWDSRWVTVGQQKLSITDGLYEVALHVNEPGKPPRQVSVRCFVSRDTNHMVLTTDAPAPFVSVAYYPHYEAKALMPEPVLSCDGPAFDCFQLCPATAPTEAVPSPPASPDDSNFALSARMSPGWQGSVDQRRRRVFFKRPATGDSSFRLDIALLTPRDTPKNRQAAAQLAARMAATPFNELHRKSAAAWSEFWSKSAVDIADRDLERIWYQNQYWLACCLKPGVVAPGLFGNWSKGAIGTAWHGDYHMNYNTQQVYWGVFSSNHAEQHLPYVDLVEKLMPMSEWNAREQFGLPGAFFPHTAYPVPSKVNPYPVPPWGYEICETPWTVQSLWWHYEYTKDEAFLKRAYPLMRAATDFLAAYARKGADGKYRLNPSVSPENWGLTVNYRLNRDCIIDLALTEFLLDAMLEASAVLNVDSALRPKWKELRENLAPYPTVKGPYGEVWLDVADAPAEWVYNVPVTAAPVFPAEQVGLDRRRDMLGLAKRTVATVRLEGSNDLVWQPMMRARLGMLDLGWFKREVRYCTVKNGIANDRVRQIDGRFSDGTNFDYMLEMGVWTENLSLPGVLNECMLQSCSGVIRLFPNTKNLGPARFRHLRAKGAFLVSAAWDGKTVSGVRIESEKGGAVRIVSPWPSGQLAVTSAGKPVSIRAAGDAVEFDTRPGGVYDLNQA